MNFGCFKVFLLIILCSCHRNESGEELLSKEIIQHHETDNVKIQTVYSTLFSDRISILDTSVIVQKYQDTLLLEKVVYLIENGDSVKSFHNIRTYNDSGLLLTEVDSVEGNLRMQNLHFYKSGKLITSKIIRINQRYDQSFEVVSLDTLRSKVNFFYDKKGRDFKVIATSKNILASELTEKIRYDSTITYNYFDEISNKIKSVGITNGDTTNVTLSEFDENNREIKHFNFSLDLDNYIHENEFDKNGNLVVEKFFFGEFGEKIESKFDKHNRPVERLTYYISK